MKLEDYFRIRGTYELKDGLYNVDGYVELIVWFDTLLVKFGSVTSNFYCYDNKLTSLEGCPKQVGGNFSCFENNLTSLEGCPSSVGGDFDCSINKLTSLKCFPKSVGGSFWCDGHLRNTKEYRQYLIMKELRK